MFGKRIDPDALVTAYERRHMHYNAATTLFLRQASVEGILALEEGFLPVDAFQSAEYWEVKRFLLTKGYRAAYLDGLFLNHEPWYIAIAFSIVNCGLFGRGWRDHRRFVKRLAEQHLNNEITAST